MKMFTGQIELKDSYKLVVGNYYFKVFDSNGNEIYYESSKGKIIDNRPKPTKEMTIQQICDELGYNVKVVK